MNSSKALRYALDEIEKLDLNLIAPQHGSLIDKEVDFITIMNQLRALEHIGFDNFIKGEAK
jgi:flavorubredoxin